MKFKKITKIICVFIILLGLLTTYTFADELSGGQGGAFLRIPVGSRPAGLGNAYVAISDDGAAPFFNPAGISQTKGTNISAMYNIMTMDRKHYQASVIWGSKNKSAIAITFNSFGVDDIIECLPGEEPSGDSFSAEDLSIGFTAAYKILPILSIGGGVKYISEAIQENEASSIGYDMGTILILPLRTDFLQKLRAGISIMNMGASLKWDTDSEPEEDILPTMRIGASVDLEMDLFYIIGTIDYSQLMVDESDKYSDAKIHFGAEGWFNKMLAVRAGIDNEDLTMGASIKVSDLRFDYAFIPDFLDEGETHKLAVNFGF